MNSIVPGSPVQLPSIEIINTGSELLLGHVTNTHLPALALRLQRLGLRVSKQTTVPDGAPIRDALCESLGRCDVLLVTGGLGPTTDDVTREVVAELLGLPLQEDADVVSAIRERLAKRGFAMRERMLRQAMVPEGAFVLTNPNGTAPGLYVAPRETMSGSTPHLFLLPGPPRELMPMFDNHVAGILRLVFPETGTLETRIYRSFGLGESAVEELVGLQISCRGDIEVGYCARPSEVDLRLIASPSVLDDVEPSVLAALGENLVSRGTDSLEQLVVTILQERGLTLTTAESCTGGLLANRITNIPGASDVFQRGFVTYSNAAKIEDLSVPETLLAEHGSVSAPVAKAMADGALLRANADFALALTGIAGPGGGSPEKPVGTVFIALARSGTETVCSQDLFPSDRETFKDLATKRALDTLRRALMNQAGCQP